MAVEDETKRNKTIKIIMMSCPLVAKDEEGEREAFILSFRYREIRTGGRKEMKKGEEMVKVKGKKFKCRARDS